MVQSVLFVVRSDDTFPSCRFRAYQFQGPLERLGVRVGFLRAARTWLPHKHVSFLRRLAEEAPKYDAVIYQKLLQPFHIRFAASKNPNVFYDFDDALWLTSSETKFALTLRAAPRIIAGNRFLAQHASRYHTQISIVPTTVVMPEGVVEDAPQAGPLRLSWVGSAINLRYLEPVRAALRELRHEGLDVELDILTEDPNAARAEDGVRVAKWSHAAEDAALRACHVGLMPLVNDEWSRGKCACKAIQYLSYGRPVIASPVGVNEEILAGKPYALLPRASSDWISAIRSYAERRGELMNLGRMGAEMVARDLSVDVWARRLVEILTPTDDGALKRPA